MSARVVTVALALVFVAGCKSDDTGGDAESTVGESTGGTGFELRFEEIDLGRNLNEVTAMAFLPGSSEFVMLGKKGEVWHFELTGDEVTFLGEFSVDGVHDTDDCGLISIAFDPDFASNDFFYLGRCVAQTHSAIERYAWDPADYAGIPASQVEIIRLGDDDATKSWHNVGSFGFEEDGAMWALFGDKRVDRHGQDPTTNLGALLKFLPNREPTGMGYESLADGPFPESDVWAHGLRSPWTGIRDSKGHYWVGDVGADSWEEIDLITEARQNFGWKGSEGDCESDCDGKTDPVASWPHSVDAYVAADDDALPSQGRVVFVGLEYADLGNDRYDGRLTSRVIAGDMCIGFIRLLESNASGEIVFNQHVGHLAHAPAWAQAPDGYVYAVANGGCGAGSIFKQNATLHRVLID